MPLQIKKLNWRQHSRDVMEFQREIYETNFPGFSVDRQFLRYYSSEIRRSLGDSCEGLFVLEEDGRARGFLWVSLIATMVDPCIGYIKNVYVAPELREQGHGKRLIAFAEEWCASKGVTRISLDASCCNPQVVALYEGLGFEAVRLRMEKRLAAGDQQPPDGDTFWPAGRWRMSGW